MTSLVANVCQLNSRASIPVKAITVQGVTEATIREVSNVLNLSIKAEYMGDLVLYKLVSRVDNDFKT